MAPQQQVSNEEGNIDTELMKRWETVSNTQKKKGTPEPLQTGISRCPDCMKVIGADVVKEFIDETDKEYPFKSNILWTCQCGYVYAELEEGKPVSLMDFIKGFFGISKSKEQA